MRRRHFLQLAASAAAAAAVRRSFALPFSAGHMTHPAAADVLSLTSGEPPLAANDASQALSGAGRGPAEEPSQMIEMLLERRNYAYRWIIDRRLHPAEALHLQQGRRYRLRIMNATSGVHAVHLQNHSFELARLDQVPVSGIFKTTLRLGPYHVVDADIRTSRSGQLLLRYPALALD